MSRLHIASNEAMPSQRNFEIRKMQFIRDRSILLLLTVTFSLCAQAAAPADWKPECIGRSRVLLPSDVETAALSSESVAEEITERSRHSVSQFRDGQGAGWSRITYLNGLLLVSNELDGEQIADLRSLFRNQPELEREYLKKRNTTKSLATVVTDVKLSSPQVLWWSYDSHTLYLQQLQNHFLITGFTSDGETLGESNETFDFFAKNTNYREMFSIPSGSGVCLPFVFIRDKGSEQRKISMSYRIKSHPDVMVVLTDSSAEKPDEAMESFVQTPEYKINDFWSQYEVSRTGKSVSSRWPVSPAHSVEMDGRKGIASFVNITRKDDSKDFGYFAIVPGDPKAKSDTPELRLFVVREANHARAKGIEPIGDTAFLELVEQIASSVQVRRN